MARNRSLTALLWRALNPHRGTGLLGGLYVLLVAALTPGVAPLALADGPPARAEAPPAIAQAPLTAPDLPPLPASQSLSIQVPALDATAAVSVPTQAATESEAPALAAPEPPPRRALTLLHTSDSYGLVDPVRIDPYFARPTVAGGLTRTAAQLATERALANDTLLVCAGNVLGPNPFAAASRGKVIVEAMNRLGYDVWLPANHDFSYGLDSLIDRIRESSASVVLTNVRWKKSGASIARPYVVVERAGLRIAFLGLVDPQSAAYLDLPEQERVAITPLQDAVSRWIPIIRHDASPDCIVAVTHVPLDQEMPLLTRESGVDLVIGGFNRSDPAAIAVHEVAGIDGKVALHAGGYGTALGRARLEFERTSSSAWALATVDPKLVRLDDKAWPQQSAEKAAAPYAKWVDEVKRKASTDWLNEYGDLARLKKGLETDETLALVPAIMRVETGAEVGIVSRAFFHSDRLFGPITSARALFYAMPWEHALCVAQVKGSQLSALYASLAQTAPPAAWVAGMCQGEGGLLVNGRPVDPKALYSVAMSLPAARGAIAGFETFKGVPYTPWPISVRRAVVRYFRDQAALGKEVSPDGFPDFYERPVLKTTVQLSTDLQNRSVDTRGTRYPDLAWRTDKSGMNWGGELHVGMQGIWGLHHVNQQFNVAYRTDQLASGQSQVSNDQIQSVSDYKPDNLPAVARPYGTVTASSRFTTPPGSQPFLLGQFGAGLSHTLSVGVELREGVEYRHHFLDPTQVDKTGGTFELIAHQTWWVADVSTDLKLFATPDFAKDGLALDDETLVSVPLTDVMALTYRLNLYRNTLYPDLASRHLLGVTFKVALPGR